MKNDVFWTVYNEIDDKVYDGTPLFEYYGPAQDWMRSNDGRPSSKLIRVKIIEY